MGLQDRQYYHSEYDSGSSGPSYGSVSSLSRYSMVTILIVINVAIFVLDTFSPRLPGEGGTHWLSHFLGLKDNQPWAIWTYVTYGFAHASYDTSTGIWHLLSNMVALYFLGRYVESRLGRFEFLRFYLAAIVLSSLGFMAIHFVFHRSFSFLVGASGAVTAVTILFVFMFPRVIIYVWGILPVPAWALGVLLLISNLMTALNPISHVAWEAHLIGAAFGAAYYLLKWNLGSLAFGNWGKVSQRGPRLKVHHPDADVDPKLKSQADAILRKISEQGEASLTAKERKTLNRYSKQLRKRQR